MASGESASWSCSVTAPSFSWRRTAKNRASWWERRASICSGDGTGIRSARRRDTGLYAGAPGPSRRPSGLDPEAQLAGSGAPRGRRERGQQLDRAHPELRRDDRLVGHDDDRVGLEAVEPAGADGRRHALGDDRVPGRDGAGEPELVLEPELRARRPAAGRRRAPGGGAARASGSPEPIVSASRSQPRRAVRRRRRPTRSCRRERSAGSRSSRVVVVTNACGRAAIRRTRCARRSGSSSREHVVEQEQRRPAVEGRQQVELGELEGEDRGPLLAPRGERRQRRARPSRTRGRRGAGRSASCRSRPPSRPSPRAAVARASRDGLAGELRGVRRVGQLQAARRGLVGRDLARGRRPGARQAPPAGAGARRGPRSRPPAAWRPRTASSARVACSSRISRSRPLRCWSARP